MAILCSCGGKLGGLRGGANLPTGKGAGTLAFLASGRRAGPGTVCNLGGLGMRVPEDELESVAAMVAALVVDWVAE